MLGKIGQKEKRIEPWFRFFFSTDCLRAFALLGMSMVCNSVFFFDERGYVVRAFVVGLIKNRFVWNINIIISFALYSNQVKTVYECQSFVIYKVIQFSRSIELNTFV